MGEIHDDALAAWPHGGPLSDPPLAGVCVGTERPAERTMFPMPPQRMGCAMKIGYVIPEWPGQTHLWIWREICHLREWQVPIRIFSTRRPGERDRGDRK